MAIPICFRLLMHLIPCPLLLARANDGSSSDANIAMIAMTTKSSINVNAPRDLERFFIDLIAIVLVAGGERAFRTTAVSGQPAVPECYCLNNSSADSRNADGSPDCCASDQKTVGVVPEWHPAGSQIAAVALRPSPVPQASSSR